MCGKTHGIKQNDPNRLALLKDPTLLLQALMTDPTKKDLFKDPPGLGIDDKKDPNRNGGPNDPNTPPGGYDPPRTGSPNDPSGPPNLGDPPNTGNNPPRLDPPNTGNNPPRLDPPNAGNNPPNLGLNDPKTGGTLVANTPDVYTGGRSALPPTDPIASGTKVSGLASTTGPTDPVTRGVDATRVDPKSRILPNGTMLSKAAAVDYLGSRMPVLAEAFKTPAFA